MESKTIYYLKEKAKEKKIFLKAFFLAIATALIFYLIFSKVSFKETMDIILTANKMYIFYSMLFLFLVIMISILRWFLIIRRISKEFRYKDAAFSFMSSLPLNSLLPSKLGDIFKAYYFGANMEKLLGAIFTERIFDMFSLFCLSLFFSVIIGNNMYISISLAIFLLFIVLLIIIYQLRNFSYFKRYEMFHKLTESVYGAFDNPLFFLSLMGISLLSWCLSFLQIYFLFTSINISINFFYFSVGIICVIIISMIPITIGGMGTRETAIIFFFADIASKTTLLAAGLLFSFFRNWLPSILGIPFLISFLSKKK
jgi:glycosyltransferase 2 family protein